MKDNDLLEKVQYQFIQMFKDLKDLEYSHCLDHLGLWTLEERRNCANLIEVFKLFKGYTKLPPESFFEVDTSGHHTRGHSLN